MRKAKEDILSKIKKISIQTKIFVIPYPSIKGKRKPRVLEALLEVVTDFDVEFHGKQKVRFAVYRDNNGVIQFIWTSGIYLSIKDRKEILDICSPRIREDLCKNGTYKSINREIKVDDFWLQRILRKEK